MKFLILTQYFPPEVGAAQSRLATLALELRASGHEVEVVTAFPNYPEGRIRPGYSGFHRKETWEGCTIHRFWLIAAQGKAGARLLNYLSFMITSMFAIFYAQEPDWIFVNSGPLFLSVPGRLLSLRFGAPMIFNVSDLWPRSVQHLQGTGGGFLLKLAEALEAWSYRKARFVNAITDGVRDVLVNEKFLPPAKILFLPNGVDTKTYRPAPPPAGLRQKLKLDGKFVLIYPGNHGYAHALHRVLEAAEILMARGSNAFFLFVGGGSEKDRLKAIAQEKKLSNVLFLDPVLPSELAGLIDMADVGLIHVRNSPLAAETRPAKMFPIMAQAKPILFAGFGEGSAIVEKANGGVVVPPEDPQALAVAVEKMSAQPEKLTEWGRNNRAYAEEHFDTGRIIQEWLRCLM